MLTNSSVFSGNGRNDRALNVDQGIGIDGGWLCPTSHAAAGCAPPQEGRRSSRRHMASPRPDLQQVAQAKSTALQEKEEKHTALSY
jgi:hypothetical protein